MAMCGHNRTSLRSFPAPRGPLSGTHWQTEENRHLLYASYSDLTALGDVDGDGFDDLATGDLIYLADYYTYKSGAMYVYYGGLDP